MLAQTAERVAVSAAADGGLEWLCGVLGSLAIATAALDAAPALVSAIDACVLSLAAAHDALDWRPGHVALVEVRPSHEPWFAQRRASLAAATGWDGPLPVGEAAVEAVWRGLLDGEEAEDDLPAILDAVAVALGDHLCRRGFAWCISQDEWGKALSVVADRGRSNVVVVPQSFVEKRYDRREAGWFADAIAQIVEHAAEARRGWATRGDA